MGKYENAAPVLEELIVEVSDSGMGVLVDVPVTLKDGTTEMFGASIDVDPNISDSKDRIPRFVDAHLKSLRKIWEDRTQTKCNFLDDKIRQKIIDKFMVL